MIENDKQLEIVREQLLSAEEALDSLHKDVRPKNEKMYELMIVFYVDMILSLRGEIDTYFGISSKFEEN